jgi:hypothetical protein
LAGKRQSGIELNGKHHAQKEGYNPRIMKRIFRTGSPCSADWDRMVGNERVRYCPDCKLDVYNFSSMSDEDVERIVSRREQRLCARVRQRPDRTVMTRNSSVSFSVVMQRISRVASIALAAAISVAPAMAGPPRTALGHNLFQIQQTRGGLVLAVVDHSGAVLPKARVTIVNEKTKTKVNGETDANGQFRISDLPDGSYEITIESLGFKTLKQSHVDVRGSAAPLKLQLELQVDFVGEVVAVNHPNGFRKFISRLRHIF